MQEQLTSQTDLPQSPSIPPVPAYFRDISSLASWTVSTSKPGCGVAALRHPSTSLFWQSDGPQPHYLNIHFFKLVEIVGLRLYLDFEQDESYTPTKIAFLAGMSNNDLLEWGRWEGDGPRGWVDIDFSAVGNDDPGDDREEFDEEDEDADEEDSDPATDEDILPDDTTKKKRRRRKRTPVLRCFLLQVKIMENHQNGKDTHLRGLQVFAKDKNYRRDQRAATARPANGLTPNGKSSAEERRARRERADKALMGRWDVVPELR